MGYLGNVLLLLLLSGCATSPAYDGYCDSYLPNLELANACLFGILHERMK